MPIPDDFHAQVSSNVIVLKGLTVILSLDHGLTPLLEEQDVDLGHAEGEVALTFGLWESNHFSTPLAADAEISVPEPLFIAAVLGENANFNVVFQSCWATPR